MPLSQPIRRKNKSNGDLLADVFPRFLSVTRDLSLTLVHITVIGQSDYSGFRFRTSTHVCSTLTQTISSSTVSCGPRGSWKSSPSSLSPGTGWTSCSFLPSSGRALGTSKSQWAGRAWWTVGYKKRNQYMGLRRNKTKYREAFIEEKSRGLCLLRSCILKKHRRMFVICLFTLSEQNGSRVLRPKYDRKSNNFGFLVNKNLVAE